jgi:hypothetical protein
MERNKKEATLSGRLFFMGFPSLTGVSQFRRERPIQPASEPMGIKRIYFSLRRLHRRNEKYISFISEGEKSRLEERGQGPRETSPRGCPTILGHTLTGGTFASCG